MIKYLEYDTWANQRWIEHIYTHYPDEEYLMKVVSHICKGQRAWAQRLSDQAWDQDLWLPESKETLYQILSWNRIVLSAALKSDPHQRIDVVRYNGDRLSPTVEDILIHVWKHGDHHRGQLASYVGAKKLIPLSFDYLAYSHTLP